MNKSLKSGVSKSENTEQLTLSPINYFKNKAGVQDNFAGMDYSSVSVDIRIKSHSV